MYNKKKINLLFEFKNKDYFNLFKKYFFEIKNIFVTFNTHPLTKKNIGFAILKYFYYQFVLYFVCESITVKWIKDAKLKIRKNDKSLKANIFLGGLQEYNEMMFLLNYLTANKHFYDIGANQGSYTILASKVIGSETFSVEPVLKDFKKLEEQIKLNNVNHLVKTYNCGLSDKIGELNFTSNIEGANRVSFKKSQNTCKVHVSTLDSFFKLKKPSLIKIDVEGFEYFILKGGRQFFRSKYCEALIIELNGSGEQFGIKDQNIHQYLLDQDFIVIEFDCIKNKIIKKNNFNSGTNNIYIKKSYFKIIQSQIKINKINYL